jgi:dolichyl-phosphate beta-glucosyltransferase
MLLLAMGSLFLRGDEMVKRPTLSVVIPCYNEAKRLESHLPPFLEFAKSPEVEIVFADDGSTDETFAILKKKTGKYRNIRIVKMDQHRGKGAGVREGMLAAIGRFRLFADSDNATPIEQADKLLEVAKGGKVAIASRYVEGANLVVKQPLTRILGSRGLNLAVQAVLLPGVRDTQCGFKIFPEEAAERVFSQLTIDGFGADLEALALTRWLGWEVVEVPVEWRDDPRSTVKPLRDGLQTLSDIAKIKFNLLSGRYKR